MQLSQSFRSLDPQRFNLVADEFDDAPGFYTGLVEWEAPGLVAGLSPKEQFASLKAEILQVNEAFAASPIGKMGDLVNETLTKEDPEWVDPMNPDRQREGFLNCMKYFNIPFTPESTYQEVGKVLNTQLPRMLTTKPWQSDSNEFRHVAGMTTDGVAIMCFFKNDKLLSFEIADLEQKILCDPFEGTAKARIPKERQTTLERLESEPAEVFFQYTSVFSAETTEWNRDLMPPEKGIRKEDTLSEIEQQFAEKGMPFCGKKPKGGIFGRLSSMMISEKAGDAFDEGNRLGEVMVNRLILEDQYSDFGDLLEKTALEDVLRQTAMWYLYPEIPEPHDSLSPGRMAVVLMELYENVKDGDGLQGWLEFHFSEHSKDGLEAGAALQRIGSKQVLKIVGQLCQRSNSAGFKVDSSDDWETFFEKNDAQAEEEAAFEVINEIPELFVKYAIANPGAISDNEKLVANIKVEKPLHFIPHEEMLGGMTGLAGMMVGALSRGIGKDLARLEKEIGEDFIGDDFDGLLNTDFSDNPQSKEIMQNEIDAALDKYGSFSGVVTKAPKSEVLILTSQLGGYKICDQSYSPENPVPAAAMAHLLFCFEMNAMGGLDMWLEGSTFDEAIAMAETLSEIGSPVGTQISEILEVSKAHGADSDSLFDWFEFFGDHQELEPDDSKFEKQISKLPSLFKKYWKNRDIEEPA